MCDGPSTVRCDWSAGGLVLDLSALHATGIALRLVALASTAWLGAAVACPEAPDTPRRCQILEEAWILLGDEHTATYLQRCLTQSELYGVTTIVTTHRLSDLALPPDDGRASGDGMAPAGHGVSRDEAQAARAEAFVAHTPARVVMRQSDVAEVELTRTVLALTGAEASLVPTLGLGYGLWAVDGSTAVVRHVMAPDEWRICESGPATLAV